MKIRLTIGKLMIEIESESEEVKIEREDDVALDPNQTTLKAFKRPSVVSTSNRGRPLGALDLQKREPSHCSTCGASHRKATMRRAGADGRPHCVECDPNIAMREFLFGGV
jgi:hypothetical protein